MSGETLTGLCAAAAKARAAASLLMKESPVGLALRQADENVLERMWRWTEPLRYYVNFRWKLGTFTFSASDIALGIIIFICALVVSRYLRAFLERRMAAHPHLDPGVQDTVLRLVNYLVIVVGVLFALKTGLNLDLTSIAVVFTALSVGIGFGLQFIAGDLAAGFLLLFERPVRVGDFISVTGPDSKITDGKVVSINLRTTVVQTNDHISVIVPNSKLTNQNLVNWSYRGRRSRISIPVGVSYDADVDVVTETLLRAAEGINHVLAEPKPSVQFVEFGDWSLNFRLLVWTERPRRAPQIKSEINYRIRRLFNERGIEIPYPTSDLHLRGGAVRVKPAGGQLFDEGGDGARDPSERESEARGD
jgi:potassium efflux system protein